MLCMDGSDGFVLVVASSLVILDGSSNFKVDVDFGISLLLLLLEQSSWGCFVSIIFLLVSSSCVIRLSFLFE